MRGVHAYAPALLALVIAGAGANVASAADPEHARDVRAALRALQRDNPELRASFRKGQAAPRMVSGLDEPAAGDTPRAQAESFIARHAAAFGLRADQLEFTDESGHRGRTVVRFQQRLEGLPVIGRTLTVTLDRHGHVLRVVNGTQRFTRIDRGKTSRQRAIASAREALRVDGRAQAHAREALLPRASRASAVWEVLLMGQWLVTIESSSGRVLGIRPPAHH